MTSKDLILMQGFSEADVEGNNNIAWLVRWTPLACATFGLIGLLTSSYYYLIGLGVLTYIGAIGNSSFYDYLYNYTWRFVFGTTKIPHHGNPRRFGCAIGGTMYITSGIGFLIGNVYLGYIPAVIMISLALVAGTTQWCFASQLYKLVFRTNEECCT